MEDLLFSAVRLAVPILFLALGEMVVERAGVLNLGLDGMLLTAALGAAVGAESAGPLAGVLAATGCGIAFALLVGVATVIVRLDQVVTGLALNLTALGFTGFVFRAGFEDGQNFDRIGVIEIPLVGSIPYIRVLFRQSILVFLLVGLGITVWWCLTRTRAGLSLRATGDSPASVDAQGINVVAVRICALLFGGVTGGLAGAYLVLVETGRFTEAMSGGRGFIAIAAVVFGGWRLRGIVIASIIFGLGIALQFELPAAGINAPNQLWLAFPYMLALVVMAVVPQRDRTPASLMKPFVRGEQ